MLAPGRSSTDGAQRGPQKNDRGPIIASSGCIPGLISSKGSVVFGSSYYPRSFEPKCFFF